MEKAFTVIAALEVDSLRSIALTFKLTSTAILADDGFYSIYAFTNESDYLKYLPIIRNMINSFEIT